MLPNVLKEDLNLHKFDPRCIERTLLRETDISEDEADIVATGVLRLVIKICGAIEVITSPMIREITNVVLLQHGLEVERLQHTRIGIPMFDLKKLNEKGRLNGELSKHVQTEYDNVNKIILKIKSGKASIKEFKRRVPIPKDWDLVDARIKS